MRKTEIYIPRILQEAPTNLCGGNAALVIVGILKSVTELLEAAVHIVKGIRYGSVLMI